MDNINLNDINSGISETEKHHFNLFPNPAKDELTLDLNGYKVEGVTVKSILGQNVIPAIETNSSANLKLNIASLVSGIYFVEINKAGITERIKFIKQ